MSNNATHRKPQYETHRRWGNGAAAPAAEASSLTDATLVTQATRGFFKATGLENVHGFVELGGGTSPTLTLQPVEVATYKDANGDEQRILLARGASIGPLSHGDAFVVETPGGGDWYLRADTVTGSPTSGAVHITKGKPAIPTA